MSTRPPPTWAGPIVFTHCKLLHREVFTHGKLLHTAIICTQQFFTQRDFFIQQILNTEASTHSKFLQIDLLHREIFLYIMTAEIATPTGFRRHCQSKKKIEAIFHF